MAVGGTWRSPRHVDPAALGGRPAGPAATRTLVVTTVSPWIGCPQQRPRSAMPSPPGMRRSPTHPGTARRRQPRRGLPARGRAGRPTVANSSGAGHSQAHVLPSIVTFAPGDERHHARQPSASEPGCLRRDDDLPVGEPEAGCRAGYRTRTAFGRARISARDPSREGVDVSDPQAEAPHPRGLARPQDDVAQGDRRDVPDDPPADAQPTRRGASVCGRPQRLLGARGHRTASWPPALAQATRAPQFHIRRMISALRRGRS